MVRSGRWGDGEEWKVGGDEGWQKGSGKWEIVRGGEG